MSMPVGQRRRRQRWQSTQSPSDAALRSTLRLRARRVARPRLLVGDHQGVPVYHHALESGIGTHVLADLLTQETGIAPGGKTVEEQPETLPRTKAER